jgi:hypothetical protein
MHESCHAPLYDYNLKQADRLNYLCQYIQAKVVGERLPKLAVVEEYIQAETRSGNIDADYTVCGFVLGGKFFPTSINLCGTIDGSYVEQVNERITVRQNNSYDETD